MARVTRIPWVRGADGQQGASWGPWRGCTECRRKCKICYRHRWFRRTGNDPHKVARASKATFNLPLRLPPGTPVFVCSLGDFFHEAADDWRGEAHGIIVRRPDLIFIIPTSRTARAAEVTGRWHYMGNEAAYDHVWFLASVADQADADELLPELLKVPVGHLGVSHEPATGVVDWTAWLGKYGASWMCAQNGPCTPLRERCLGEGCRNYPLANGETSTGMRNEPHRCIEWLICGGANHTKDLDWHMPIEAARADRDQAAAAGIPYFFKGHGEWCHESQDLSAEACKLKTVVRMLPENYRCVGRKAAGALLDGQKHEELPWARNG